MIRCIARYANEPRNIVYNPGDEFEPDAELLAFLMADAPGCFEVVKPKIKAVKSPRRDKAVRAAKVIK